MSLELLSLAAAALGGLAAIAALAAVLGLRARIEQVRATAEQAVAAQRGEAEALRNALAGIERAVAAAIGTSGGQLRMEVTAALDALRTANDAKLADIQTAMTQQLLAMADRQATASGQLRVEITTTLGDMRTAMDTRLAELRAANEQKLAEIQASVNEQLHAAVEKQMTASFARVTEQFAAVQKAMGEMQAVGAQIGDIKRLFGNVKTRGFWGETQVRAMLDDILPEGAYETNWRPRADSRDAVEFAIIMPGRAGDRPRLPVDAKFPTEDYERLLAAQDAADAEAERAARAALARRIADEAKKVREKYITPPLTVDFGVIYLPTDGLYAEIARVPGLLDEINRVHQVVILGPSLFPALLRTIHLGHITLSIEQKAEQVHALLRATRTEMRKMDAMLERLHKQSSTLTGTLDKARVRTRKIESTLKSVEAIEGEEATRLLGVDEPDDAEEDQA